MDERSENPVSGRKDIPTSPAPPPNEPQGQRAAQAEQFQIEREAGEHHRDEVARWILARGMWAIMVVIFIIIVAALVTIGWHLLLPEELRWLDKDSLSRVRSSVLSGVAVAIGTTYLRRYIRDG